MTQWKGTKAIIRDVIIVWIFTTAGGFLVGFAALNASLGELVFALGLSNTILAAIAFCISGCMIQEDRWKHLAIVAIFVWLTSIVNVIMELFTIGDWIFSIVWIFVWAGLGGGLSLIIKPNQNINRTCPYCAELIKVRATVCKHCGRDVPS